MPEEPGWNPVWGDFTKKISPKSEPAQELQSRAVPSVVARGNSGWVIFFSSINVKEFAFGSLARLCLHRFKASPWVVEFTIFGATILVEFYQTKLFEFVAHFRMLFSAVLAKSEFIRCKEVTHICWIGPTSLDRSTFDRSTFDSASFDRLA